MKISANDARARVVEIEKKFRAGKREYEYGWGMNQVSDHDEDYVFDALFDVPNR